MFFSNLLILFLLSSSCFPIHPTSILCSFIPIVFSYSFYFFYGRSSQSRFNIHTISSMIVHPNRVFLFILFLQCSSSQLYFPFLPISSMLVIQIILFFSSLVFYALSYQFCFSLHTISSTILFPIFFSLSSFLHSFILIMFLFFILSQVTSN